MRDENGKRVTASLTTCTHFQACSNVLSCLGCTTTRHNLAQSTLFQLLYLLLYAILQAMSIRCDWSNLASNIYGCSASQCYNQKMSHNKFSSLSSSFSNHHHLSVPSLHSTNNHYNQKRISKQLFGINDAQLHQKTQIFLVIIRLDNFARGQIQV